MTTRAVVGLLVLNAAYAGVGLGVLWALGAWSRWSTAARLLGVGYLVGLSSFGVCSTVLLALGVPFGLPTIVATCVAIAAAAVAIGRARSYTVVRYRSRPRLGWQTAVATLGAAAAALYAVELFRMARLQGVFSFDGWAFWVTRGKAVYFFDSFDEQIFSTVPNPAYPPVVPILDAAAFDAIGSADTVTLHVQYWFFAVGFLGAVAGLLVRRVPGWILWPSLVLMVVVPRVRTTVLAAQADYPLDYLVVAAAVLVALWLADRQAWQLHAAAVLLACGVLVKREGLVFAACVFAAALVATLRERRLWPRLLATGAVVALASVPWRLWYRAHGIEGELGTLRDAAFDRTLDSLRLAVEVLSDTERWSLIPTIGLAAVVLAALWGRRAHAVFATSLVLLFTVAASSTSVVFPEVAVTDDEAVNPVVRLTAASVLAIAALTPLLLAGVWTRAGRTMTRS